MIGVSIKKRLKNHPLKNHPKIFHELKVQKGLSIHAKREVYIVGICNSPKHSNYTNENNSNVLDRLSEQLFHLILF